MKRSHLSLRLPTALERALAKASKARGEPRSHIVREAVARYLSETVPSASKVVAPSGRGLMTAREFADVWRSLPHLNVDERRAFADDVESARAGLGEARDHWE